MQRKQQKCAQDYMRMNAFWFLFEAAVQTCIDHVMHATIMLFSISVVHMFMHVIYTLMTRRAMLFVSVCTQNMYTTLLFICICPTSKRNE